MIPLRDNIPSRTTPVVNFAMIAACSAAFFLQVAGKDDPNKLIEQYGMIPKRVMHPEEPLRTSDKKAFRNRFTGEESITEVQRPLAEPPFHPWLTLVSCIFLHGGWMHYLGNMWFLFIFGDNVEDRLGHFGYLVFYLVAGALASAAHLASNPESTVPTIGASGAIAGVMGAYFVFYPRAMVMSAVPLFVIIEIVVLPAPLFLGIWFLLQFFQGTFAIAAETAGVAWWAHIGGFVVGFAVAGICRALRMCRPAVVQRRPNSGRVGAYRYHR